MAVILLTAIFVAGCGLGTANDNDGLPTEEQLAAAKAALAEKPGTQRHQKDKGAR